MSIDLALRSILANDSAVAALVSTRIYPMHLPQDEELPAIVFQRVSADRDIHHGGVTGVCESRFRFYLFDDDPLAAKALSTAVREALHGYDGTSESVNIFWAKAINEIDLLDIDLEVYQVNLDLMVAYKE